MKCKHEWKWLGATIEHEAADNENIHWCKNVAPCGSSPVALVSVVI